MNVILLEKILKLGELGDQVTVKAGFGRNYLIPSGKAVLATPANIAAFDARRAELEKQQQQARAAAEKRAEALNAVTVTIPQKASDEGKLFGSVSAIDIAKAVSATGVELAKNEVKLPDGGIRNIGEFTITAQILTDIAAIIKVNVVAD